MVQAFSTNTQCQLSFPLAIGWGRMYSFTMCTQAATLYTCHTALPAHDCKCNHVATTMRTAQNMFEGSKRETHLACSFVMPVRQLKAPHIK